MDKRILEALQMQPLSEEEMAARHILGRLYGPIATCTESTRNGRLYNKPLWEKALKDNIFLEKVATKALFLELGHPADREETDMKQACACIPEVPKIVGDDLYAYVDILDTPNGRLLKTLVDYGFVPGISSRGSGDIIGDNQVDPETFFLETWDIVQLPAVKKARLNVCESLDSNSIKLKKALAESYKAAKEEDKDTMKKALGNLNIDINSELVEEVAAKASTEELEEATKEIPWDPETDEVLMEEAQSDESEDEEDILDDAVFASFMQEELTEDADEDLSEETPEEAIDADEAEESDEVEYKFFIQELIEKYYDKEISDTFKGDQTKEELNINLIKRTEELNTLNRMKRIKDPKNLYNSKIDFINENEESNPIIEIKDKEMVIEPEIKTNVSNYRLPIYHENAPIILNRNFEKKVKAGGYDKEKVFESYAIYAKGGLE